MKKISKLCLCMAILSFCTTSAFADGMVFEPVEMPSINTATETTSKAPEALPKAAAKTTTKAVETKETTLAKAADTSKSNGNSFFDKFSSNSEPKVVDMSLKENQDMQSALVNLDTSQVELRQNLQSLQTKYAEVDAQYEKYKAERAALHKQIKVANKKLKSIESVKSKIRKNML